MKSAFLIIDMQVGCRNETPCKTEFDKAIEYINEIGQHFRSKNLPVILVKDEEVGGVGSELFEFVDAVDVSPTDFVIHKKFCNAFWETNLDALLKEQGVDSLIISGFAAEHCVLFTYNGARERGYKAFLLQHGIAGFDAEEIKRMQLLRPVMSFNAIEHFI